MSWTAALTELRQLLNDDSTDKPRFRQQVLGQVNGTNKAFRTFEPRRVTDFTTAIAPFGVYKNSSATPETVTTDNLEFGQFVLSTAPTAGDTLEASFYVQWFTDTELNAFLLDSANWLGTGTVVAIQQGLQPAAKKYAAAQAYQELAIRWSQDLSMQFKSQDIDPETKPINPYTSLANQFRKDATDSRDQFYKRQGRPYQPLFKSVAGNVGDVPPKS